MEALRLGCDTYALDYNPVAVLINKAVSGVYPQKFGRPRIVAGEKHGHLGMEGERKVNRLVEEVKRWANGSSRKLTRSCNSIIQVIRTAASHSVTFGPALCLVKIQSVVQMPIMRHTWLAREATTKVALRMVADKGHKRVEFEIVTNKKIDFAPEEGTVSLAHVRCPVCSNTIDDDDTRRLFGEGKSGFRLVAVVQHLASGGEKTFRLATDLDRNAFDATRIELEQKRQNLWAEWGMDPVPDEPVSGERPSPNARGLSAVTRYEMNHWGDLFNSRQKLALVLFAEKIREAHRNMLEKDFPADFAKAIATYLGFALDKLASHLCILTRWRSDALSFERAFDRQALPMIWDFGGVKSVCKHTRQLGCGIYL